MVSEISEKEALSLARGVLAQIMSAGHNMPGPTAEDIEKAFWATDSALARAEANAGEPVGGMYGEYTPITVGTSTAHPAPQPLIRAMFETVDETIPVTGTTEATIKRVEQNDDGSYTVVIDHWPQPSGPVEALRETLVEAGEFVATVFGENQPARSWAYGLRRKIDEALSALTGKYTS